jgi:hypothetical protein
MKKIFFPFIIIFLALLIGWLYIAPQLAIRRALLDAGQPYVLIQTDHHSDEANFYWQRVREASVFPILPSRLLAGFLYLFGGAADSAYLGATFVFSAIIFLMFYWLGRLMVKNRWWAAAIGLIGSLTPIALHLPRAFQSLNLFLDIAVKNFIPIIKTPLDRLFFNRFDDPMITAPFYLLAIISLLWFWKKPDWRKGLAAGFAGGILFNIYFHYAFYWGTVLILTALYILIFQRQNREAKYSLIPLALAALAAASPYFINYFRFQELPWAQDYVWRVGIEIGRGFRFASIWFDYLAYVLAGVAVYWFYWRKGLTDDSRRKQAALFWIFLIALFIVWNIQLITGFVPHPGHWRKAASPVLFVILIGIIYEAVKNRDFKPILKKTMAAAVILASVLLIVKKGINVRVFAERTAEQVREYSFNPRIVESWGWINKNLTGQPKIAADSFLTSVYLGIYTSARPFLTLGVNAPASNAEIENRYLLVNKIFRVPEKILYGRLQPPAGASANLSDDRFYLYSNYFRQKSFDYAFTSSAKTIPQSKIEELINRYRSLEISDDQIAADYIYYGPWEKEIFEYDFDIDQNLELVYKNPEVKIYKIEKIESRK